MHRRIWLFTFLLAGAVWQPARLPAETPRLPLMPWPEQVSTGQGQLLIDGNFDVALKGHVEPRLSRARKRFLAVLSSETGLPLWRERQAGKVSLTITTAGPSRPVEELGEDESYRLVVTPGGAQLSAPNPLGVLHGLQTFLQLVEPTPQGFAVPAVSIADKPRFPWRGLMIDSGRHFMPIPVIERNLDGMEAVKLNVFHWHLSEDQGFRAESRVYPRLQELGSNGLYYTREQMRHIIAYARDRGIRVVPEFDMPCHTTSWFVGYPHLASAPGPYQIETKWGVFDPAMDPTRESTFAFIDHFLSEMTALFPDAYFHIGGDECNGKQWDANPDIQAFMRAHNLKDDAALQAYFTARVQKLVAAHHKIMEGWDEVLQPDTPRDVVIQSWRGPKALAAAARQGNRGILSNGYYLDLNQPASQHYLNDPLGGEAASLTSDEKSRILGGEAAMWTEYVDPENIDSRLWPRLAAIAERLWSPQEVRNVDSMYSRLEFVSQRLQYEGLHHQSVTRIMLQRMSGEPDPRTLEILAAAVQPPEGYQRGKLANYNAYTPLNRMVDAVPPESEVARRMTAAAERIGAGKETAEDVDQVRRWLTLWRDNNTALEPLLPRSGLTADLGPISQDVSSVAGIGLVAMEDLINHMQLGDTEYQWDMRALRDGSQPKSVLRNMVVPAVQALVNAAAPDSVKAKASPSTSQ